MTTFLREQVIQRKLAAPVDRGRIWRLVPDDAELRALSDFSERSPEELVLRLGSDRGTVRLLAQRTIVEARMTECIPGLRRLADSDAPAISRAHALWTLAGLDAIDAA